MAYQNVGTPRFYCNIPEWLISIGVFELPDISTGYEPSGFALSLLTLPVDMSYRVDYSLELYGMTDNSFVAILGHTMANEHEYNNVVGDGYFYLQDSGSSAIPTMKSVINGGDDSAGDSSPPYNGFSIWTFAGNDNIDKFLISGTTQDFGSVIIGTYYDMPHSPELSLSMGREMDGVKKIRTKGGVDLIDNKYIKPPMWGNAAAWELYSGTPVFQGLSRGGRRVWDLSFNYLDDKDVFSSNQSIAEDNWQREMYSVPNWENAYDPGDITWDDYFEYNILTDDSFYSQVIHKTNGGKLPFIFQPDSSNNNSDGFAICKFDMNEFQFDQVANGVYNMKLKIREVW